MQVKFVASHSRNSFILSGMFAGDTLRHKKTKTQAVTSIVSVVDNNTGHDLMFNKSLKHHVAWRVFCLCVVCCSVQVFKGRLESDGQMCHQVNLSDSSSHHRRAYCPSLPVCALVLQPLLFSLPPFVLLFLNISLLSASHSIPFCLCPLFTALHPLLSVKSLPWFSFMSDVSITSAFSLVLILTFFFFFSFCFFMLFIILFWCGFLCLLPSKSCEWDRFPGVAAHKLTEPKLPENEKRLQHLDELSSDRVFNIGKTGWMNNNFFFFFFQLLYK